MYHGMELVSRYNRSSLASPILMLLLGSLLNRKKAATEYIVPYDSVSPVKVAQSEGVPFMLIQVTGAAPRV